MENNRPINILFLCTGNSARSILAEALLNEKGGDRFRGFSAGSFPKGNVHSGAIDVLRHMGVSTTGHRSKSWDEFAGESAPMMDLVVTVCDNAAAEVCPVWPSAPVKAHWNISDPAAIQGSDVLVWEAFLDAYETISGCVDALIRTIEADPSLDTLAQRVNDIDPSQ